MTVSEFSSEFDILYNNIMSNKAPGLSEYEKSVFLTKAQYEILKNYFNPKGNKYGEGFDDSAKRQTDFAELINISSLTEVTADSYQKLNPGSILYRMPDDLFIILNEVGNLTDQSFNKTISIVPISFDEYTRLMSKPYKEPLKNQAWRLSQSDMPGIIAEIIIRTGTVLNEYKMRYIRKPAPIILADLAEYNASIDGIRSVSECELNPVVHPEILQRAVELAKSAYEGDINSIVQLGQRTE
jgi:hypothetical protein